MLSQIHSSSIFARTRTPVSNKKSSVDESRVEVEWHPISYHCSSWYTTPTAINRPLNGMAMQNSIQTICVHCVEQYHDWIVVDCTLNFHIGTPCGQWTQEKVNKSVVGQSLKVCMNPEQKVLDLMPIVEFTTYISYFVKVSYAWSKFEFSKPADWES